MKTPASSGKCNQCIRMVGFWHVNRAAAENEFNHTTRILRLKVGTDILKKTEVIDVKVIFWSQLLEIWMLREDNFNEF